MKYIKYFNESFDPKLNNVSYSIYKKKKLKNLFFCWFYWFLL